METERVTQLDESAQGVYLDAMLKAVRCSSSSSHHFPTPPSGGITLTCDDGGISICFPPKGVWRTYRRHVIFSITLALFGIAVGWITPARAALPLRWVMPGALVGGGVYLFASTINRGRARTRVTTGESGLSIENVGPFRSSRRSWARSRIDSVSLSGYRSVCVTLDGTTIRAPLDRSRSEVRWLVMVVRSSLNMRSQGSRRPLLPADTALTSSKKGDTRRIVAPAEYASAVGAAMFVPALAFVWVGLWNARPDHDGGFAPLLIILLLHAAVAAWVLLELQRRLASPVTFCVSESELVATRPRLLGRSRFKWTRDQIDDVIAGAEAVFVLPKRGRPAAIRFRLEATPHDARWVAETIRHEMNLHALTAEGLNGAPGRGTPLLRLKKEGCPPSGECGSGQ